MSQSKNNITKKDISDSLGKIQGKLKKEKVKTQTNHSLNKFFIPFFLIIITLGIGIYAFSNFNISGLTSNTMSQSSDTASTTDSSVEFYALAYHWGFVLYNNKLQEIPSITVNQGSKVQIHLLSASELTNELHEQIEQRDQNNTVGMKYSQSEIMDAMDRAESNGLIFHGLSITGQYMMDGSVKTNNMVANATSIQNLVSQLVSIHDLPTLTFNANRSGSYGIYCTVPCGDYHSDMYLNNAFNVI